MKKHRRAMLNGFSLLLHGGCYGRVVIANAHAQVLAEAVEVLIALFIPQVLVLPALENQWRSVGNESSL